MQIISYVCYLRNHRFFGICNLATNPMETECYHVHLSLLGKYSCLNQHIFLYLSPYFIPLSQQFSTYENLLLDKLLSPKILKL